MTQSDNHVDSKADIESVWDYPRPPALEDCDSRIRIEFGGNVIVDSTAAKRVLETSHPPTYYVPREDVQDHILVASRRQSFCEFKGMATYFDVVVGEATAKDAAWCYPNPSAKFSAIRDHVAFYAQPMERCFVDDELVQPQAGGFYGGWVTRKVTGPFKGAPGTEGW